MAIYIIKSSILLIAYMVVNDFKIKELFTHRTELLHIRAVKMLKFHIKKSSGIEHYCGLLEMKHAFHFMNKTEDVFSWYTGFFYSMTRFQQALEGAFF